VAAPDPTELPPEAIRRVSPPTRGSAARPLPNTVFEAEPQRADTGPHVRSPGVFQNSIIPRKERLCEEFCP
jgi:hypothetical protein